MNQSLRSSCNASDKKIPVGIDPSTERHNIQGWAKADLQLWVHETQSLFLYYYLLNIVLFSIWTAANLLLPTPVLTRVHHSRSCPCALLWLFHPNTSFLRISPTMGWRRSCDNPKAKCAVLFWWMSGGMNRQKDEYTNAWYTTGISIIHMKREVKSLC